MWWYVIAPESWDSWGPFWFHSTGGSYLLWVCVWCYMLSTTSKSCIPCSPQLFCGVWHPPLPTYPFIIVLTINIPSVVSPLAGSHQWHAHIDDIEIDVCTHLVPANPMSVLNLILVLCAPKQGEMTYVGGYIHPASMPQTRRLRDCDPDGLIKQFLVLSVCHTSACDLLHKHFVHIHIIEQLSEPTENTLGIWTVFVMCSVAKVFLGSAKTRQAILMKRPTSFWA